MPTHVRSRRSPIRSESIPMSKHNAKKPAGKRAAAAPRHADSARRAMRAKRVVAWPALALVVVGAVILVAQLGSHSTKSTASTGSQPAAAQPPAASGAIADVAAGRATLIDVRTPAEFAAGHAKAPSTSTWRRWRPVGCPRWPETRRSTCTANKCPGGNCPINLSALRVHRRQQYRRPPGLDYRRRTDRLTSSEARCGLSAPSPSTANEPRRRVDG